jgi:hypothetical protein
MSTFPPSDVPQEEPAELTRELRDYMVACIRAARPSESRELALRLLGEYDVQLDDAWESAGNPVDWEELEAEALRQGCTVADVVYDRAGYGRDAV